MARWGISQIIQFSLLKADLGKSNSSCKVEPFKTYPAQGDKLLVNNRQEFIFSKENL